MRERIWLFLRNSSVLRKIYKIQLFAAPMHQASYLLLPSSGQKRLCVQTGPAEGPLFDLSPRWELGAWQGNYEFSVQQSFVGFLKPAVIVFDGGANYGELPPAPGGFARGIAFCAPAFMASSHEPCTMGWRGRAGIARWAIAAPSLE